MKLHKKVLKAVSLVKQIDLDGTVDAEKLAGCTFMSVRTVKSMCKKMVVAEYLISSRGPKGGYSIGKIPSLYNLIYLFDPNSVSVFAAHDDYLQQHINLIHCDLLAAADRISIL